MSRFASASRKITRTTRSSPTTRTNSTLPSAQSTRSSVSARGLYASRSQKRNQWEYSTAQQENIRTNGASSQQTRWQHYYNRWLPQSSISRRMTSRSNAGLPTPSESQPATCSTDKVSQTPTSRRDYVGGATLSSTTSATPYTPQQSTPRPYIFHRIIYRSSLLPVGQPLSPLETQYTPIAPPAHLSNVSEAEKRSNKSCTRAQPKNKIEHITHDKFNSQLITHLFIKSNHIMLLYKWPVTMRMNVTPPSRRTRDDSSLHSQSSHIDHDGQLRRYHLGHTQIPVGTQ